MLYEVITFNENSKAEVAISGLVGERVVNGKIDRLIVNNDEVIIVDFKTNSYNFV